MRLVMVRHVEWIEGLGFVNGAEAQAKAVARAISEAGFASEWVISSMHKQATATGEVISEHLGVKLEYALWLQETLKSAEFGISTFEGLHPDVTHAILVTHEPLIVEMLAAYASSSILHVRKGETYLVDRESNEARRIR